MFTEIITLEEYKQIIQKEAAVLAYFSTEECNVCKVLKPKIGEHLKAEYPKIKQLYINLNKAPELAAQNRIFTVPTVLIFFNGKEFFRKSRNLSINELMKEISRPYKLMFD